MQKQTKEQLEVIDIYRDYFQLKINNQIFYNMIGKYPSMMAMFAHLGFKKQDK